MIENYDKAVADKTQTWCCHHRIAIVMNCSAEELKAKGLYENRPAHELIFLTKSEHSRLHNVGKQTPAKHQANLSIKATYTKRICARENLFQVWKPTGEKILCKKISDAAIACGACYNYVWSRVKNLGEEGAPDFYVIKGNVVSRVSMELTRFDEVCDDRKCI